MPLKILSGLKNNHTLVPTGKFGTGGNFTDKEQINNKLVCRLPMTYQALCYLKAEHKQQSAKDNVETNDKSTFSYASRSKRFVNKIWNEIEAA